jgi:UDP-N-acetylglucosamine--N-acetylmuramyl-(pentapeptide) pyrophosphoryl-undecaprenol N-acetylglucosamine transferase
MKVVLAGGGTGGHFYPLIAVAEQLNSIADREHLAAVELYYFSDEPYDQGSLQEEGITYVQIPSGKMGLSWGIMRRLQSVFTTGWGILVALSKLFMIYPDAVIGKGGYASVPTVIAAWILRIPIIVHESDTVPGRANKMLGKLANRVALTYPQAATHFPADKVAHIGQPIRRALLRPTTEGAYEYLALDPNIPVIYVVGGSSGAQIINQTLLGALPELVKSYQVIHQVGPKNLDEVEKLSVSALQDSEFRARYRPFGFLSALSQSMVAGVADIIVTRAGSALQEIAVWGIPSIVIPITRSNGDHQRKNAYAYASSGAAIVMEEANLAPHILVSEINRVLGDSALHESMAQSARTWARPDAAAVIAQEVLSFAQKHEE